MPTEPTTGAVCPKSPPERCGDRIVARPARKQVPDSLETPEADAYDASVPRGTGRNVLQGIHTGNPSYNLVGRIICYARNEAELREWE